VNWSAELVAEVPPGVATVTSTTPAEPAGEVAVTLVSFTTVNEVAAVLPKLTAVAPVSPLPAMVTTVPPASGPAMGEISLTTGATVYVKWSAELVAELPPGVVTVTSTVPASPAGEVAVMLVSLTTVPPVAAALPKLTAVAPVNPLPAMVTTVPPTSGPAVGEIPVTTGATVYV
jgi:hypothetical protein